MPSEISTDSQRSVTESELIERARSLAPILHKSRAAGRNLRRIPDESFSAMIELGLLRAAQPRRFGGFELPFGVHTTIADAIAETCGSTAWVAAAIGAHHWMLSNFDVRAQEDVWGQVPNALVASAFRFTRDFSANSVDDGYEVSGLVQFASGIHGADWVIIAPPVPQKDGAAERFFMLVPRSDYEIKDTWRSPGLRATGTHDLEIAKTFIPSYRTISFPEIDKPDTPGSIAHGGSAYRLPFFGVFNYFAAGPVTGLARGALNDFCKSMGVRRDSQQNKRIAENSTMQLRVSESSAEIDVGRLILDSDLRFLRRASQNDGNLTKKDIARIIRNVAYIAVLGRRAVSRLTETMGAHGLQDDNFVHLAFSDIQAAGSHLATVWDSNAQPYGKALLGIES